MRLVAENDGSNYRTVRGDVIVAMNDVPTMTLDYLRTALKRPNQSDPLVLQIEREGKLMYVTFNY